MSWSNSEILGMDTETTGVSTEADRIVTAAILRFTPGSTIQEWNWIANPQVEIPAEAAAIHGFTTARAQKEGSLVSTVISEIENLLMETWQANIPLVMFNACFDLSILNAEMRRWLDRPLDVRGPIIDGLIIDRHCDRYRRGSRRLADTCRHYGITLTDAHSASADTLAAMRLAWKLARVYPEIGRMDLDELQVKQSQWYRESQLSFAGYLRDKIAPGSPVGERAGILLRAQQVEDSADGWPMRIKGTGDGT